MREISSWAFEVRTGKSRRRNIDNSMKVKKSRHMTKVRGIRGATTADTNTRGDVLSATKGLLEKLIEANEIDPDDVAAAFFTTTPDLDAEFPAAAARLMGWTYVALMGASEINVPDAPPLCVRVLILINTDKPANELTNIYLRGAVNLRARGLDD